ncbi:hypothetical protein, partial [Sphingomonas sp.]|uniref:O-linked N-acetylglucosamine transferase family protein n=1 Tax=Sphingomonas sp. TaxID=28214 RepID=UPI0025E706E9
APSRIVLSGPCEHSAFLAAYNEVDVALQTFPYCGGVTLLEGLWMGVPGIAMNGETFAARHGVSHLSNLGLAQFVAQSERDYVQRAVRTAHDWDLLSSLRSQLRDRMRNSPLCNRALFGRNLGIGLRRAWAAWCDRAGAP